MKVPALLFIAALLFVFLVPQLGALISGAGVKFPQFVGSKSPPRSHVFSFANASYAISVLLFAGAVFLFLHRGKEAHDLAELKTRVMNLQMSLMEYVREHEEFPPTLQVLMTEVANTNMTESVYGEKWTYKAPEKLAPTNTTVLTVSSGLGNIIVDRSFDMHVLP